MMKKVEVKLWVEVDIEAYAKKYNLKEEDVAEDVRIFFVDELIIASRLSQEGLFGKSDLL